MGPAANPEEVFDFVVSTVHRLVRHRYSKQLIHQKLRAQLDSFLILLHNIKDIFVKRQIVCEISRSWGHKNSFPTPTETIIQFFREFQGGYTKEQYDELDKEITCALTILSGRTLSRVLQNEKRASQLLVVSPSTPPAAITSLRNAEQAEKLLTPSNNKNRRRSVNKYTKSGKNQDDSSDEDGGNGFQNKMAAASRNKASTR